MLLSSLFSPTDRWYRLILALGLVFTPQFAIAEPLRVALSPDYPPLVFKEDGMLVGIEVANASEVARILGRELQFVEMPMQGFIPALEAGRVDVVMSGFSATPERRAQVAFAQPFMQIGQMAIIRVDDAGRYAQPRALYRAGIRIGVEPGTTGETYVREHFDQAIIKNYADAAHAFTALRAGDTDVYVHDAPTSWGLAASKDNQDLLSLYRPLTSESLAWAVRKGNVVLLGQLNAALEELEGNGRLHVIQNYWIPIKVQVR
jgi:polar amino acid transport system substrate-binding protein